MVRVSSHILDSVKGSHAAGIRCQLFRLDHERQLIFDVHADDEGRIAEEIAVDKDGFAAEFELVIHSLDYFSAQGVTVESPVKTVVLRFDIDDPDARYHLPVMLAPHACSAWWSA